jgi:hypothetical protein
VVYGDSLENCSPEREAQVRILHPPLSPDEALAKSGFDRVSADAVRKEIAKESVNTYDDRNLWKYDIL